MLLLKKISTLAFLICLAAKVFSQNVIITQTSPQGFTVCNSSNFTVSITNNEPAALASLSAKIELPTGANYLAGTVAGQANELNISNLNQPVFNLANLPAGATKQFTIAVEAGCPLVQAIDSGQKFSNKISLAWGGGGSKNFTSQDYIIETPLLFVTATTGLTLFGKLGDMVTRSISIRNNRNGSLTSFTILDSHPAGGFSVSANAGTVLTNTATDFAIRLTAADFQKIGDGDGLFEEDEVITIAEKLTVQSCGIDPKKSVSNFKISWGCAADTCQKLTLDATLNFFEAAAEPLLVCTPKFSLAEDFCDYPAQEQSIWVKNIGTGPARNAEIRLINQSWKLVPQLVWYAGFAPNTFKIDSAGTTRNAEILASTPVILADCAASKALNLADIRLPEIAAGDSIRLKFLYRVCEESCSRNQLEWSFIPTTFPNCPPDAEPILGDSVHVFAPEEQYLYSNDTLCHQKVLKNGDNFSIDYVVGSSILKDSSGTFRAIFRMPCGVSWVGGNMKLNGKNPVKNGTDTDGDVTIRFFDYQLPFDAAQVEGIANFKFTCGAACLAGGCDYGFSAVAACPDACDFDVDSLSKVVLQTRGEVFFDPAIQADCGYRSCQEIDLFYACDDSCTTTVEGYIEHDFDFRRINFGRADNDDNRLADATGAVNFSKIRLDRFLPGDTSELRLSAAVHSISAGKTFKNAFLKVFFEANTEDNGWDGGLAGQYNALDDVREVFNQLEILDKSSGQKFTCKLPRPDSNWNIRQIEQTLNITHLECLEKSSINWTMFFTHDISTAKLVAAGCPLPPNFEFSEGDSIKLLARHTFTRNPVTLDPIIHNLRVRTFASIFNGYEPSGLPLNHNAPPQDFSCSCQFKRFQLSQIWTRLGRVKFNADPCILAEKPLQLQFQMLLGGNNFFPFEYRPLGNFVSWTNLPENPVRLAENRIQSLVYQDNTPILTNANFPFTTSNGAEMLNVAAIPEIDEGFAIKLFQKYDVPCSLADKQIRRHTSDIRFAWQKPLPMLPNPTQFLQFSTVISNPKDTFGFIPARPFMFASAPVLNVSTSTDVGFWEINFISTAALPAQNVFFYLQNPSGQLTDFEAVLLPSGTVVPIQNGIFKLGNLAGGEVKSIRLRARNLGCTTETLTLFYGWACSPLASKFDATCNLKTLTLTLKVESAKLELDILNPSGTTQLCSEQSWHGANVANVLAGPAFDVQLEAALPAGLKIVAGSCQMSYPDGAAWKNIPDPTVISSFGRGWKFADLIPALTTTGLPGFQNAPANAVSIRFKTVSECGFISGSYLFYKTTARENCGGAANLLIRPGEAVRLDGLPDPDAVSIAMSSSLPSPVGCGDTTALNFSFVSTAASGLRDSVFVVLPSGVKFVQNSYVAGANAPAGQPQIGQIFGKTILKWQQKQAVAAGQSVVMTVKLTNFGSQPCGILDTIFVRTTTQQLATCVSNGSPCDAQALTGETFLIIQSAKTEFEIVDFDVDFDAGIAAFNVKIRNNSTFLHTTPTVLNFYFDKDNSGTLTAGDVKRHSHAIFFPIGPGDVIPLKAGLPIDLREICHLVVAIEAGEVCTCSSVAFAVDSIWRNIPPKVVCSGNFIDLGVLPTAGHSYKWTPATALACDTCAFPQFFFKNETATPATFKYKFLETAGDCSVQSDVQVTVLPMPRILTRDTTICAGQAVKLETTPAVEYTWFGSGISNPMLPTQVVSPIATSFYFVQLKDAAGCVNFDTLKITVQEAGFAAIGPDTLGVCGNADLQFNAFFNPNFQYSWSPASAVSNSKIHNPKFVGTASTTLVLTVQTVGTNCLDRDTVFVGFSQNPIIAASATALTSCFGDTAAVIFSGAQDFFVAPSAGVFCQNQNCSVVGFDPQVSTVYTVVGFNNFGCSDTLQVEIEVPGKVVATTGNLETCRGEAVKIHDVQVSAGGWYCKVFQQASGCDSTSCIFLTVLDTFSISEKKVLCPGATIDFGGQKIDKPGTYCLTFASADGCDSTHCLVVEKMPAPVVDTLIRVVVAEDSTWQVSELPSGFSKYAWTPTTNLSCSDCPNPKILPPAAGVDSVEFKVVLTNADGCSAKVIYRVRYLPPCSKSNVLMPTAFTPNGDDTNDILRVVPHEGFESYGFLKIYDRWGELLFESSDALKIGWDGSGKRGKQLPMDTYLYILQVVCPSGEEVLVGDVTLLR